MKIENKLELIDVDDNLYLVRLCLHLTEIDLKTSFNKVFKRVLQNGSYFWKYENLKITDSELNTQLEILHQKYQKKQSKERFILYQTKIDKQKTEDFNIAIHWYFNDLKYLVIEGLTNETVFYKADKERKEIFDYEPIYEARELNKLQSSFKEFKETII